MSVFGFILDGVIVVLLGAVIFFAVRLSLALRTFRDNRAEMRDVVDSLSRAILQADGAIKGLREAARESGRDLQGAISEARSIQDELKIMIESGDSLARRMESAVDRARPSAPAYRDPAREGPSSGRSVFAPSPGKSGGEAGGGFLIRDRDYDRGETPASGEDEPEDDLAGASRFASKAERDLYEALKKKGVTRGGGGS
ncbi:MAG TPA: DUF6468 domain-containing protein [Alphaproteobacteria bacterium]|nr:DUF6468 domain-containing protein [Alphaproteobacteria bacterium]